MSVPHVSQFKLFGLPMNEKAFSYLMAASLACLHGQSSALTCAIGVAAGALFRNRGMGLGQLRFPSSVVRLASSFLSPFLSVTDQSAGPKLNLPPGSGSSTPGTPAQANGNAARGADLFANRNADFEPIPDHLLNHVAPSEANINAIVEMGFTRERAMAALSEHGDSVDLALNALVAGED